MKMLKLFFIAMLSFVMIGCSTSKPILEPNYLVSGYTEEQIETAILNAQSTDRGWALTKQNDGLITGHLINRQYTADIQIPYTASGYTIKFVSSNLDTDGKVIHRNYNRWVANLDKDIRKELAKLN